jgi:hypothetical protein
MQSLDAQQIAAHEAAGHARRGMILFELPSGNYGVWDGGETITWNTFTFNPGGRLLEIERDGENIGTESNSVTIRLYAVPESELTPEVLYTIHAENYRYRPVTIWVAYYDPDTGLRIGEPILQYQGTVQTIESKDDGGRTYIEARVASRNEQNTDSNGTMANAAHHALVSPGDLFFEFAGVVAQTAIYFGRATPATWNPGSKETT